jgi:hypothetical protein
MSKKETSTVRLAGEPPFGAVSLSGIVLVSTGDLKTGKKEVSTGLRD